MFERFCNAFRLTASSRREPVTNHACEEAIAGVGAATELFESLGGATFEHGIYRVHNLPDVLKWGQIIGEAFPEATGHIVFGYDWLGCQFTFDPLRDERGEESVLLFEPGAGEVLEIPATLETFHNEHLVDSPESALASELFGKWLSAGGRKLEPAECAGYKVPLFLGGKNVVGNLEIDDMEVYWGICSQLVGKIRDLPDGTEIGDVSIS